MTNPYYVFAPEFIPGTKARSDDVNLQYQAIQNAFDLLPGQSDALTTGTATFAPESGTGNAYVVTMPDTRTTENDGDEVIFFATHTNTAAATLEVDGLGAKPIVRADGGALAANDLQSGLLYVMRYDATNVRYQLVGPSTSYLTNAQAAASAAAASAAAALTSQNLAQEWAANPVDDDISTNPGEFSALHWAEGSEQWATRARDSTIPVNFGGGAGLYSALHWADGASEWAIRAEDSPIPTTVGGDGVTDYSAFHWAQKALNAASLQRIVADIPTATPPTNEAVTGTLEYYDSDETDLLGEVGFRGSNVLRVYNRMHGGTVILRAQNTAGTPLTMVTANPDDDLVQIGAQILATDSNATITSIDDTTVPFAIGNRVALGAFLGMDARAIQTQSAGGGVSFSINPWGGDVNLGHLSGGTGNVNFYGTRNNFEDGNVFIAEAAAGVGSIGGYGQVWIRNDTPNTLMFRDDAGTDFVISSGGGVLPPGTVASSTLRYSGSAWLETEAFRTGATNSAQAASLYGGSADHVYMGLYADAAAQTTRSAFIGYASVGTDLLSITNEFHGGSVQLQAENAVGTAEPLFIGDPDGVSTMYHTGEARIQTDADGARTRGSSTGDPALGNPATIRHFFLSSNGNTYGLISYENTINLEIDNRAHGGQIILSGETTAGAGRNFIVADPDVRVDIYDPVGNVIRARTNSTGRFNVASDGNLDTEQRTVNFTHQDGTVRGSVGHVSSGVIQLRNLVHGSGVLITQEDGLGATENVLESITDGETRLFDGGVEIMHTHADGITIKEPGAAPFIAFQETTGATRQGFIQSDSGGIEIRNEVHGGTILLQSEDLGGTNRTLFLGDPDGAVNLYHGGSNKLQTTSDGIDVTGQVFADGVSARVFVGGGDSISAPSQPLGASTDINHQFLVRTGTAGDQVGYQAYVNDATRNVRAFFGVHDNDVWGIAGTASSTAPPFVIQWAGENLIQAVPNGAVILYHNNLQRISTTSTGATFDGDRVNMDLGVNGNTDGVVMVDGARITFEDPTERENWHVKNESAGGSAADIKWRSTAVSPGFHIHDGTNVRIYDGGNTDYLNLLCTTTFGSIVSTNTSTGGLLLGNAIYLNERSNTPTNVAGDGCIFVLDTAPNQLWFQNDGAIDYPVAYAAAVRLITGGGTYNFNTAGNGEEAVNGIMVFNNGSSYTVTLSNSTNTEFPVDASFQIIARGAGTITISEGTGMTLWTNDGGGWTDSAGSSTLSDGVATVYKYTTTEWYLWGNGLTA